MIRSLGARKGCPWACPTRRVASSAVEHSAFNRLVLSSNLRRPIPVTALKWAEKSFTARNLACRHLPTGWDMRRRRWPSSDRFLYLFLYLGTDMPARLVDETRGA